MLTDKELKVQGKDLLSPFSEQKVQAIGYDLTAESFYRLDEREVESVDLQPMESIFVKCREHISLPSNIAAHVHLRNSRIRQGLLLTAPVYYPGHKTPVYFRITNISASQISLGSGSELASITFEKLDQDVDSPYAGTFQMEDQYRGMGSYKDVYSTAMKKVDQKMEELHAAERRIYTNVLSLLAIFVAIFSIINVNVSLVGNSSVGLQTLLVFNLCTLGAIGFLITIARTQLCSKLVIGISLCLLIIAICVAAM